MADAAEELPNGIRFFDRLFMFFPILAVAMALPDPQVASACFHALPPFQ
jgi:hypothetical protein